MTQHTLLVEQLTPNDCSLIEESSDDGKNVWLSGIFMQSDVRNKNGRTYPRKELEKEVMSAKKRIAETSGIMGELDHPQSLTINLDRVSHIITELDMQGNDAIGKAKIIDTPMGQIAKELIKSGVAMGVSSRGAGAVNESGGVTSYQLITVDLVATPSAPGATPASIYESLEHAKNGDNIMDLSEAVRHDKDAQKYFKKEIMKWLNEGLFMKKK